MHLVKAATLLLADLDGLLTALEKRARVSTRIDSIGRSHGIHAEPVTFGLKMAGAYAELTARKKRLAGMLEQILVIRAWALLPVIDPRIEAGMENLQPAGADRYRRICVTGDAGIMQAITIERGG